MESITEINDRRDRAIEQSRMFQTMAMKLAETDEQRNQILLAGFDIRSSLVSQAEAEKDAIENVISSEERLNAIRRKAQRDARVEGSGLFDFSGIVEGGQDKARNEALRILDDPKMQPLLNRYSEARRKNAENESPFKRMSWTELLPSASSEQEDQAFKEIKSTFDTRLKTEGEIGKKLIESKEKEAITLNQYRDASERSNFLLGVGIKDSQKVIAALEATRQLSTQEAELALQADIERTAILENTLKGSIDYDEIVRRKTLEYDQNNPQKIMERDRQFLTGLRNEYKYLANETLDIYSMNEKTLVGLAPLMDGLSYYVDIEKQVAKPRISTLEGKGF